MDYILSIKDRIVTAITHNQGRALLDRLMTVWNYKRKKEKWN